MHKLWWTSSFDRTEMNWQNRLRFNEDIRIIECQNVERIGRWELFFYDFIAKAKRRFRKTLPTFPLHDTKYNCAICRKSRNFLQSADASAVCPGQLMPPCKQRGAFLYKMRLCTEDKEMFSNNKQKYVGIRKFYSPNTGSKQTTMT